MNGQYREVGRPVWVIKIGSALLTADGAYPLHRGSRLELLDGPERLETGWWDERGIARDYYTAVSRAKKRVRIVGPKAVVRAALARRARRDSGLVDAIRRTTA